MSQRCKLYRHFGEDGGLLYIGISLNALGRLIGHRSSSHWFDEIVRIEIESFETRDQAIQAEREAILREKPKHNIAGTKDIFEQASLERVSAYLSRRDLVQKIVSFKTVYSVREVAEELSLSTSQITVLMDSGKLGFIMLPPRGSTGKYPRRVCTGWQLIDFIEAASDSPSLLMSLWKKDRI